MSRTIRIKGSLFIENKSIAIQVIQEFRNGIYFENNHFKFERYDAYDQISQSEKMREMIDVENEYLRRYNYFLDEKRQREADYQRRLEDKRTKQLQNEHLQRKREELARIKAKELENHRIEAERKAIYEEVERLKKEEAERKKADEVEKQQIEAEKLRIREEIEQLKKEEAERKKADEVEKQRIEAEKLRIREEKADTIIKNAEKQGYKLKKEIKKDNTIQLVLQKRIY